jgi:hypothetical protein
MVDKIQNKTFKEGKMADFFPKREADLLEWLKNFGVVVVENTAVGSVCRALETGLREPSNQKFVRFVVWDSW